MNFRPLSRTIAQAHMLRVLSVAILLSVAARAQAPIKATPCDLVKDPQKYTRQWVEVRATVSLHFEDFSLVTKECDDEKDRGIWVAYGGDEPTPTPSTANDTERTPGTVMKVEGIPVPLRRGPKLDLFKARLMAQRRTAPDGTPCYDHCPLYSVTATLVGLFMGAPNQSEGPLSGYGHMGCCHLFTIQEVKEVEAVRTAIPAGGRFSCSTDKWEMDHGQAAELFKDRPCQDYASCLKDVEEEFKPVAAHWGDPFVAAKGHASPPTEWQAEDLLTGYALEFHHSGNQRDESDLVGATATRKSCRAIEAPLPATAAVGCKTFDSDFRRALRKSAAVEGWQGKPEAISHAALEEAARQWKVSLLPDVTLNECEKPAVVEGEQITWCYFTEPTSLQNFSVQLSRSRPLHTVRGWDNVAWKLSRGWATVCAVETAAAQ